MIQCPKGRDLVFNDHALVLNVRALVLNVRAFLLNVRAFLFNVRAKSAAFCTQNSRYSGQMLLPGTNFVCFDANVTGFNAQAGYSGRDLPE